MMADGEKGPALNGWFPFTDYDFYAYLTCGSAVIFSIDYTFNKAEMLLRNTWAFPQVFFLIAASYIVGQIIAGPSSAVIEHVVMRKILSPPIEIQTLSKKRNWFEYIMACIFAPREYAPVPARLAAKILIEANAHYGTKRNAKLSPEAIFQVAYSVAMQSEQTRVRLNNFKNLYGFCRNACFASLTSSALMLFRPAIIEQNQFPPSYVIAFTFAVAVGMFGRFLKFYAAFSLECLRALPNFQASSSSG